MIRAIAKEIEMRIPLVAFALLFPAFAAAEGAASGPPSWLAGYWLSCEGGRQTVEAWIADGSGVLVGVNQSKGAFEHLRIAKDDDGYAYFASPEGAPVVRFAMTSNENFKAVFENPSHDFPQTVVYERKGKTLEARIEGVIDGKQERVLWKFKQTKIGAQCR